jgi:hypothetical protein
MRMSKRRVINGNVFIQTRTGGWRLVKNGYIRTRRGWQAAAALPDREHRATCQPDH